MIIENRALWLARILRLLIRLPLKMAAKFVDVSESEIDQ